MPFSHIKVKDSLANESLSSVWRFLKDNYPLYKQSYGAFVNDVLSSDGNYLVVCKGEPVFFMNFISDGLHNLVVNLMVGKSRRAIMLAIGLSMYTILNKGHNGLVFHVNVDNKRMLGLVRHSEITETNALRPGLRSFKCTTSHLIKKFGTLYHHFLMFAPMCHIKFFRCRGDEFYIADGWECINSRYHLTNRNGDPIIYLKDYNVSFHYSFDLLQHLYDSNEGDGISHTLKQYLYERGITNNCKANIKHSYKPVDAIFLPTFGCNLGCRYCYSEATPEKKTILDKNKAIVGIDYIFNNAKDRGVPNVSFSFLGGGEPLTTVDLNCYLVDYIRRKENDSGISASVSICTNGTIYNDSVHRLLCKSNRIQFSFDGYPDVQNLHRPFAGGNPTYETVVSNIKKIKNSFPEISINVRATTSDYSVTKMPEFVKLLSDLHVKSVSFEPLIVTGRAVSNGFLGMPDMSLFAKKFIEAREIGFDRGIEVNCSASSVFRKYSFCGATYNNFVITPEGLVSTCVEVSSLKDPLSNLFIIGDISNGRVNIDAKKLSNIRKYDEVERLECINCISNKSCRGNCPVRTLRFQNKGDKYINELCIMQTYLLGKQIISLHEKTE